MRPTWPDLVACRFGLLNGLDCVATTIEQRVVSARFHFRGASMSALRFREDFYTGAKRMFTLFAGLSAIGDILGSNLL